MKRYDIVFKGEILLEKDIGSVKRGLATLLKKDPNTVESLFSGEDQVLKRGVEKDLAHRIRDTALSLGAVFELRPVEGRETPSGSPRSTPAPMPPRTANGVACPECGTVQPRSTGCLNCGAFLFSEKKIGSPSPPLRGSVDLQSASNGGVSSRRFFRGLRLFVLVGILVMVAANTVLTRQRTTDWGDPLRMGIYPINGDGSAETGVYISTLSEMAFEPISRFFKREAGRYGLPIEVPVTLYLGPEVETLPPPPPTDGNRLAIMLWSLKFRMWAGQAEAIDDVTPDIKMFVIYRGRNGDQRLDNSFGLQKGLAGVVHGYADREFTEPNNVVIAHEMLHVVGATDKYDAPTLMPDFPEGFAEPYRSPLYPQQWAEIMGGRIPTSPGQAMMPSGLDVTLIGEATAREIRWIKKRD